MKIGEIAVANRVLLAPMSGVTDAPFRRLAAALGAGLVVSEMTASDDLVRGHRMSQLRCEAAGIGPHVVQLAGCETHWMAEGARVAEAAGAEPAPGCDEDGCCALRSRHLDSNTGESELRSGAVRPRGRTALTMPKAEKQSVSQ